MNPTPQEKIDYIYETLKKQESRRKWSIISYWGSRIAFLLILYLGYMFISHSLEKAKQELLESVNVKQQGQKIVENLKEKTGNLIDKYTPKKEKTKNNTTQNFDF